MNGERSYRTGLSAEDRVAQQYERAGSRIAARRWRGAGGEIDLVVREGDVTVFVEVKVGSTHAAAAERVGPRQTQRIFSAAAEFIAGEPAGSLSDARFDVALVDRMGRIELLHGALSL
jgi:putative endonuclease